MVSTNGKDISIHVLKAMIDVILIEIMQDLIMIFVV